MWLAAGSLLALFFISCFWRPVELPTKHLVSAAKIAEYALLAPAAALLFRRAVDLERFLMVFVAWTVAAAFWGILQFVGLVSPLKGQGAGHRADSFLGHEELGPFAGATLAVGLAALVLGERRRLTNIALVAGWLGVLLDASIFAYLGVVLAAVAAVWVGRHVRTLTARRMGALAAIVLALGVGVYGLRTADTSAFFSFLGITSTSANSADVQTGSQRALLLWIGWRMWVEHPVLGIGFDRSKTDFQPYLAAARRRFQVSRRMPFPTVAHPLGVQNLWVQLLADTGIVGLALGLATFVTGLVIALRAARRKIFLGLVAAGWILVAAGTYNAIGIIAGIPLDAVAWLGLGLAIAASQLVEPSRRWPVGAVAS